MYQQSEHLLGKIRKKRQNSPDLEAAESVIEKKTIINLHYGKIEEKLYKKGPSKLKSERSFHVLVN